MGRLKLWQDLSEREAAAVLRHRIDPETYDKIVSTANVYFGSRIKIPSWEGKSC